MYFGRLLLSPGLQSIRRQFSVVFDNNTRDTERDWCERAVRANAGRLLQL
jgi:hypothetical protein